MCRVVATCYGSSVLTRCSIILHDTQRVLQSRVVVQVCPTLGDPCPTGGGAHVLNITAPVTDKDAKRIFRPLRRVKILELTAIPPAFFSGWDDEADKRRFQRRVREYGAIWCCVHAHPVRLKTT